MSLKSIGLVGFGNIAGLLVATLADTLESPLACCEVLVRPDTAPTRLTRIRKSCAGMAQECRIHREIDAFVKASPCLVIECAGHEALALYGAPLLTSGTELIVSSVGALADDTLHRTLAEAARAGNTRLVIPAGAIGALDIIAGLKFAGIDSVNYRSRKPPAAWQGTKAEQAIALDDLNGATVFYTGTARTAALDYPRNANVAAALSLAGIGFDRTQVQLIADPEALGNHHEFDVDSAAGSVSVRIQGKSSKDNPRTSLPTVYSLVREVLNRTLPIAV